MKGIFLISIYGVQVRGVATPNVLIGVLMFFGGVCQFISGIMEFVSGNTVSSKSDRIIDSRHAKVPSLALPYSPPTGLSICLTQ